MTTIALPRPRNALLDRLRTIQFGVGARGAVGAGLATQRGGAAAAPDWWKVAGKTCVAAYLPKDAASLEASYVNLVSPGTHDATLGSAPVWTAPTGWKGNGNAAYLKTGLVPGNSWSAILWFSNCIVTTDYNCMVGNYSGAGAFLMSPNLAGGGRLYWLKGASSSAAGITSGVMGMSPGKAYLNGAYDGDIGQVGTIPQVEIYVGGAANFSNSPNLGSQANTLAVAIYSDDLTASDHATVYAALTAL